MNKLFELESHQDFEYLLHKIINNLTYCSKKMDKTQMEQVDNSILKAAEDDVRKLLSNSNFDIQKVEETIATNNWDKERMKCFVNLLVKENSRLLYASLNHHTSEYGETITQSDWLLNLILGTSELNTMKYSLLVLILSTVDSSGVQSKKLCELNKDMLLKTIEMLEIITEES